MKCKPIICLLFLCGCTGIESERQVSESSRFLDDPKLEDSLSLYPIINYSELFTKSLQDLRIIRNSIYAKHGSRFTSADLQDYFDSQQWYIPIDSYSDSLLSESDLVTLELIKSIENIKGILWHSIIDLDGNGISDLCLLVEDENHSKASLFINDKKIIINNQYYNKMDLIDNKISLSNYWRELRVFLIDVDSTDDLKEIVLSQRFLDEEDPGFINLIITKNDKDIRTYNLSSNSYNSGTWSIADNKFIFLNSDCPFSYQIFEIIEGELNLVYDFIGEIPTYGCPACFTGDSKIKAIGGKEITLATLQVGDTIMSYNLITEKLFDVTVESIINVSHNSLVKLIFNHDTVTSTLDHPFYVLDKGWSSLYPEATSHNYDGYFSVGLYGIGDTFLRSDGSFAILQNLIFIDSIQRTYTITKLSSGNSYFVNDILVGVESLNLSSR